MDFTEQPKLYNQNPEQETEYFKHPRNPPTTNYLHKSNWLQMPEIKSGSSNFMWMKAYHIIPFLFDFSWSTWYSWDSPKSLTILTLVPSFTLLSVTSLYKYPTIHFVIFLVMDMWAVSRSRLFSPLSPLTFVSSEEYGYTLTWNINWRKLLISRLCVCWTVADTKFQSCQGVEPPFTTGSSVQGFRPLDVLVDTPT